jgi:hypothetical protein
MISPKVVRKKMKRILRIKARINAAGAVRYPTLRPMLSRVCSKLGPIV